MLDVGDGAPADVPALDDFPAAPVFVGKADATTQMAFGGAGTGAGPCVVSPENGTLFPKNWLRPRLEVTMPKDHNAVEFRLSVEGFAHPLLAYSTDPTFTLDKELWRHLTITAIKKPVTVQVRTAQIDAQGKAMSGPTMPSEVKFTVAPAEAPGKIVYWALPMGFTNSGVLKGFGIGEEGVRDVLTPEQVKAVDGKGQCIGCHTGTPDGKSVSFQLGAKLTLAGVEDGAEGTVPPIGNAATLATLRTLNGNTFLLRGALEGRRSHRDRERRRSHWQGCDFQQPGARASRRRFQKDHRAHRQSEQILGDAELQPRRSVHRVRLDVDRDCRRKAERRAARPLPGALQRRKRRRSCADQGRSHQRQRVLPVAFTGRQAHRLHAHARQHPQRVRHAAWRNLRGATGWLQSIGSSQGKRPSGVREDAGASR